MMATSTPNRLSFGLLWMGLVIVLLAGSIAVSARPAAASVVNNDCTNYWSPPQSKKAFFYPELHAVYWYWWYDATAPGGQNISFRLQGQYPYARNSSYHFYPTQNGGSADNSLRDVQIVPDLGSVNPALPGVDRHSPNRSFTLWIVPSTDPRVGEPNTLVITPDSNLPTFMLRAYRPDYGYDNGGVPLPTIESFSSITGDPVPCPPIPGWAPPVPVNPELGPPASDPIHFYRSGGDGYYPNDDNKYLVARGAPRTFGKIAILRFFPPTFLDTYRHPEAVFTGNEEVRYMSLCTGGQFSTRTSQCIADDQFILNQDGYYNVVVGPDDRDARAAANARGYNYLVWYNMSGPMLLYRQMVPHPDFIGSIYNVPRYNPDLPAEQQMAELFIGEYAPSGRYCDLQDFMNGSDCGMPLPQPILP